MDNKFNEIIYLVEALEPNSSAFKSEPQQKEGKTFTSRELEQLGKQYEYTNEIDFLDENIYTVFANYKWQRESRDSLIPFYTIKLLVVKTVGDDIYQEVTYEPLIKVLKALTFEKAQEELVRDTDD